MNLRATKTIGGFPYAGSVNWVAAANTETKNIRIYKQAALNDDLFHGAQSAQFATPGTQSLNTAYAFVYPGGQETTVEGYSTTLTFDPTKLEASSAALIPPFDADFTFDNSVPGTLSVSANSSIGAVPIGGPNNPTPLFDVEWNVLPFQTVDITYVTTDPNSVLTTPSGPNNPVTNVTEYVIGDSSTCSPYLLVATEQEWQNALSGGNIYAMEQEQWNDYMFQWDEFREEGEAYPNDVFISPYPTNGNLYVWGGGGGGGYEPNDAGLVMAWGYNGMGDGNYCSAWKYDYLLDPDLSNSIISLVVTAPQFGASGQINQVSFGLQNPPMVGGPIRAWYWNCGAAGSGAPIIWNTPTRITIDTSKVGVTAATPTASAYMNNPGFNLKIVQWLIVDENGTWVGGATPVPQPGGMGFLWNYWHWIMISPKTTLAKQDYTKWSQAAVVIDTNDPPLIQGWDEPSDYNDPNIMADDWNCTDDRPITDIHWWGSFIGWNQPEPPPIVPKAFHLGIWTDVPDPNKQDPSTFSRPGTLIWENYCDSYVWNFAGYDLDPRKGDPDPNAPVEPNEACFQYNQLLPQDEWFYQEYDPCDVNGTVYWLSIAAVYNPTDYDDPNFYPWGWKTRPHNWNDDAVRITQITNLDGSTWPPTIGAQWGSGVPIQHPPYPDPDSISFDLAFELTTNESDPNDEPASPDLNFDGWVDFRDFAIFADQWLTTGL